ncbi:MAG TPA: histone deacetylase family protein [Methylophilaceae bacterium]|nr:histone deacetylase family protein [Methylophilaceae bacterium]
MTTAFINHPDTLLHVMDGRHPESPARITAIRDRLASDGLLAKLARYEAPAADDIQLRRVHTQAYIDRIRALSPRAGLVQLDPDTAMGPMSLSACLHASGAAVMATDLVMRGEASNAFCCTRPPGHHAGREYAAGFCIFNHVAVGAAHALAQYGLERVAIVDFDVHHGDGTEDIFKDRSQVMLCSTFQHPFYPHKGADSRTERMVNVPLPAGTGSEAFRAAVEKEFAPALARFKPQMVFVSAGFDAHADDPLAQLQLTTDDYRWVTRFIRQVADRHAEGRIVSILEGGYRLSDLADSAAAHVAALAAG